MNQFEKCIKCVSNKIFKSTEIKLIYNNLIKRGNCSALNHDDFEKYLVEMIEIIIHKLYQKTI